MAARVFRVKTTKGELIPLCLIVDSELKPYKNRQHAAVFTDPLWGMEPMVHVNTLPFQAELIHGNLVTRQVTGSSHSVFRNTDR